MKSLRTKRATGSKTEVYYYTGNELTYITDGVNNLKYYFVRDTNGRLLQMIDYTASPAKSYIYILDVHGNVIGLADETGILVNYEYDAYGYPLNTPQTNVLTGNGEPLATANPFRYSGYQFDPETGFYYLKYRYYVPSLGRFLTRDPMVSYNRYRYCNNNPVSFIDPLGLATARPELPSRPTPIDYLGGATISDAKRRNSPNLIRSISEAINSPDLIPGLVSEIAEKRVANLSKIPEGLSPRALTKLAARNASEIDILSSGARALSNVGKMVGIGGALVGGYLSIQQDINNPLYNDKEERLAIGIDSAAAIVSVASVFVLPVIIGATAPIWVGVGAALLVGTGLSLGASYLKEVFIDNDNL